MSSHRKRFLILTNPHLWITTTGFILLILLHYPHQISVLKIIDLQTLLGLERHALERILFLFPITYAAYRFGLAGGIFCISLSLLIMLPRIIFLSAYPRDALFETIFCLVAGVLIVIWLESRRKELRFREQALGKLKKKSLELRFSIRKSEENRKRISALHTLSTIINKSLELDEVLKHTVNIITGVMAVDVVFVLFLDEDSGDFILKGQQGLSEKAGEIIRTITCGAQFKAALKTDSAGLVPDKAAYAAVSREFSRCINMDAFLIVTVKARDETIGALAVAATGKPAFSREDREFINTVSIELAAAAEKTFFLKEIRRVGRRFQEIFEKAHDAIWIQDQEGRMITANQTTAHLMGYTVKELMNFNVSRFYTEEGSRFIRSMEQEILSGKETYQPFEQKIIKKNDEEAVFMFTTSLLESERTPAFLYIARDITEQRRLQSSLRLYADQISTAYEEERKRIARELHDDTIQILVAISRQLDNFISKNRELEVNKLEALEKIQNNVDESLIRIRRFIQDLRPPTLEYLGLLPALRELIYKTKEDFKLKISFQVENIALKLTKEQELLIYRIVQEALRNIWKHSKADNAEVSIFARNKATILRITDNGKGFMLKKDSQFLEMGKLGLMGMQERAYLLGGKLEITSEPGFGTTITLIIV